MRRLVSIILTACLGCPALLTMAGCATQQATLKDVPKLAWPAPPDTSRIQFVRSIVSDQNISHDTTFSQEIINFLAGTKPPPNRIVEPMGLAVSDDGQTLYVADTLWNKVFIFDFAQSKFASIEGFVHPVGLALDGNHNLYVVDQAAKRISVFDPSGKEIRNITDKSLVQPTGIAIDRQRGKVYVVDTANRTSPEHNVKVFSLDGKLLGKLGKGYGNVPGAFMFPTYVALDSDGNVYVSDTLNDRIQKFDPNGKFVKTVGAAGDAPGYFGRAKGVAVDTLNDLYVVDSAWSNVQIFNSNGQLLMFFAGRGPMPGLLGNPTAIAIDKNNHIWVGDYINHRVEEYQLVNTVLADTQQGGSLVTTANK